jgi:hypothetical protein
MATLRTLSACASALAALLAATSASASTADNDCVTFGDFDETGVAAGLGYQTFNWWSDSNGGGSTRTSSDAHSYTWCGAQPNTTYHWNAQPCFDVGPYTNCGPVFNGDDVSTKFSVIADGGFENWTSNQVPPWWGQEGTGPKGIDLGIGNAHTGHNNAWINTTTDGGWNWNAFTYRQWFGPNLSLHFTAWVRTSDDVNAGFVGIRNGAGQIVNQVQYGPIVGNYQRLVVDVQTSSVWDAYEMGIGFWGPGWIQIDDVWVTTS